MPAPSERPLRPALLSLLAATSLRRTHGLLNPRSPSPLSSPRASPADRSPLEDFVAGAADALGLPLRPRAHGPPGPVRWPVVGTLPDFLSRGGADALFDVHDSLYSEFGDVYGMSILGDDEAIVCDPVLFEEVFRAEGKYPYGSAQEAKVFIDYHREAGNNETLKSLLDGEEWLQWRRKFNVDVFGSGAARSYLPLIAAAASGASAAAGRHEGCGGFDVFVSRTAFDMFCGIMFGENPGTADAESADEGDVFFVKNTQAAFGLAGAIMLNPLEKMFGSKTYDEFVDSMDTSMDFARERTLQFVKLAEEQQRRGQGVHMAPAGAIDATEPLGDASGCPIQGVRAAAATLGERLADGTASAASPPSCISRLVARGEMSPDDMAESIGALLLAGVDTTAYVLQWLYLNLASHPAAQTALAEELHAVLAGGDLTEDALDRLPYLRACIRESHRLTPPGPITGVRRLTRDVEMGGYPVPKGQRLSLNIIAFPMDPRFVEDPEEFRPERFLPDAVRARRGTPSEVIDHRLLRTPFGSGVRTCLGARLAEAEIMVLTARLVQDWEMGFEGVPKWTRKQGLFVKADPFPQFQLKPRKRETHLVDSRN